MTELLLIIDAHPEERLCPDGEAVPMRWRIVDGPSTLRSGTGIPPDDARGERVRIVVGARLCPLHRVSVPARQRRQMLRAIPFVVEDFLATDLERQHLALPQRLRPGHATPVAVVDRDLLRRWLEFLSDVQLEPVSAIPLAALVPVEEASLTLVGVPGGWLFATPRHAGMFEDAWWGIALPGLEDGIEAVHIVEPVDAPVVDDVRRAELESHELEVSLEPFEGRADDWLVQRLGTPDGPSIELLQGEFARHDDSPDLKGALTWLATAAATTLAVFVATEASQAWMFASAAERLREDSETLYRELFPDDRRIVNPLAQMRAHLASSGVGSQDTTREFLDLFAPAAKVIAASNVELQSLTFNGNRGDASIEVLTRAFATLEQLKTALEKAGVSVEIGSAEQEQGAIRARLRIKGETA